ncbi:MAG TPA: ChrR family anti-sigma-E factor [Azospirillaceae bacterium]|nr:ChrR family anti-sigma-E factor [Azospirillaceae bacterium]
MAIHHPPDELLLDYAAGNQDEAVALVVATHLALCPACRTRVADYEALGGVLLEDLEPVAVGGDLFGMVLRDLDATPDAPAPGDHRHAVPDVEIVPAAPGALPRPLRDHVGGNIEAVPWRSILPGLEEFDMDLGRRPRGRSTPKARLLRLKAGRAFPRHTHRGTELLLVLAGSFQDETGHYVRGDLSMADGSVEHQPVADDDQDCVCLIVTEAPLRLTGRFMRFLNPVLRL